MKGTVRTRRRSLLAAAVVVWLVGSFAAIAGFVLAAAGGILLALLGPLAFVLTSFGAMRAVNRWQLERRGLVRGDATGLWLDDELVVDRKHVRYAHVVPTDAAATTVRFAGRLLSKEVDVASEEEARALLASMRLEHGQSVARYGVQWGSFRGMLATVGGTLAALAAALALAILAPSGPSAALVVLTWATMIVLGLRASTEILVGADGVRLRRRLSRERFVPFHAIAKVTMEGRDLAFHLRHGEVLRVHHESSSKPRFGVELANAAEDATQLAVRVNAGIEAHSASSRELAHFARGNRTTRQWLDDLVARDDAYRTASTPADELWRVVADPALPATARAGAAYALRETLDDEGRTRLRVIADACAGPQLRVALERTADDEDLEEAYARLEDVVRVR